MIGVSLHGDHMPSVRAMAEEKERSKPIGTIEKILEIIGVEDPGKKLEKLFQVMNVKAGDLNKGAFDIQKIYDELERTLKQAGLDKISETTRDFLKSMVSRLKIDDIKSAIDKLKIKDGVDRLDKAAEILNFHARYQAAKDSLEKLGVKNAGAKLKQMLEESVIQERIEDFERYLEGIGIEQARDKIGELLEAMGLKGAYEDIKDLIGWNITQPL
ncbi:MAG: hypothetical protein JW839_16710 [Candidatus Lokiarchaeota archaeon]|nr:hypothetical protein [Candidatus Lokiarchaeota archaeon]